MISGNNPARALVLLPRRFLFAKRLVLLMAPQRVRDAAKRPQAGDGDVLLHFGGQSGKVHNPQVALSVAAAHRE